MTNNTIQIAKIFNHPPLEIPTLQQISMPNGAVWYEIKTDIFTREIAPLWHVLDIHKPMFLIPQSVPYFMIFIRANTAIYWRATNPDGRFISPPNNIPIYVIGQPSQPTSAPSDKPIDRPFRKRCNDIDTHLL